MVSNDTLVHSTLPIAERSIKGKVPFKQIVAQYTSRPQDAAELRDKLRALAIEDNGYVLCVVGAAFYSAVYDHITNPRPA